MSEHIYVPLQPWSCSRCGALGVVEAPAGLDAEEVVFRAHLAHIESNPVCADEWGTIYIRLEQTAPMPD